ncbi:hypothetical protein ABV409_07875 [Flagellimonas sp. DF-77]|uniref:hypothetical protein n=1 Tax=Flagellimonas algarum TaxID=3230298 RepID=UPI003398162A
MRYLIPVLFLLVTIRVSAQAVLDWNDLERGISWEEGSVDATFPGFLQAEYSEKLSSLEGKEISLIGYLIVLDGIQSIYMLSKNPMASCFFCGNGGPETVSEVFFDEKNSFKMDDLIMVTGILRLNRNDPSRTYYLIEKASAFGK